MHAGSQVDCSSGCFTIVPFKGVRRCTIGSACCRTAGLVALGIGRSRDDHVRGQSGGNTDRSGSGTAGRIGDRDRVAPGAQVGHRSRRGAIAPFKSVRRRATRSAGGSRTARGTSRPAAGRNHGGRGTHLGDRDHTHRGTAGRIGDRHFMHAGAQVRRCSAGLAIIPQIREGADAVGGGRRSAAARSAGGAVVGRNRNARSLRLADNDQGSTDAAAGILYGHRMWPGAQVVARSARLAIVPQIGVRCCSARNRDSRTTAHQAGGIGVQRSRYHQNSSRGDIRGTHPRTTGSDVGHGHAVRTGRQVGYRLRGGAIIPGISIVTGAAGGICRCASGRQTAGAIHHGHIYRQAGI